MNHTVYFADKSVIFTSDAPGGECYAVVPADPADLSRAKVTKILESHNCVAVVSTDPDAAFRSFAADFTQIEAAGGVVVNDRGEWLMMRRNGRWDLPKGHLEAGESLAACAEREIAEETGIAARVERPLCETLHAYWFTKTARWELKRTHWFRLRPAGAGTPAPQTEEGIERVSWCAPAEREEHLRDAFPTIRRVAAAMEE